MSIQKIEKLVEVLWSEFIPLAEKGFPIHFTFTSEGLTQDFFRFGIECSDPVEYINECIKELILVEADSAYLLNNALKSFDFGFSPAILFICQQVLIVEEMVKTEDFGPNAYFPRYRKALSENLDPTKSLNPFDYDEFESIWQQVAKEINRINSNKNCITFYFGKKKGPTQAKRFPLSQALLTKNDIYKLITNIGRSYLKSLSRTELYEIFRLKENVRYLSSRGKSLLKQPALKEDLLNQIQAFLSDEFNYDLFQREELEKQKKVDVTEYTLKAYLDPNEWFDTSYVINIFNTQGEVVADKNLVAKFYNELINFGNYFLLTPSKHGDAWLFVDKEYEAKSGDVILIVYKEDFKISIIPLVERSIGKKVNELESLSFSRVYNFNFFKLYLDDEIASRININNSRFSDPKDDKNEDFINYAGGISVNKSRDRFSAKFLPDKVVINGNEIVLKDKIMVGERVTTYERFRADCLMLERDENFKISLESGESFTLKVAPLAINTTKQYDFLDLHNFKIPIVQEVDRDNSSIQSDHALLIEDLITLREEGKFKELIERIASVQNID